jgi:periplasmic iron binding protein
MKFLSTAAAVMGLLALAPAAQAREYPIGGPVHAHDMEIASSYLVGVEMAPMSPDMPTGPDVIHLETDVHATADNVYGFADGAWIPYMAITYSLQKQGADWHSDGVMLAMTAKDGPHYANDVKMDGPGTYTVALRYASPETNGFRHHVDKETGVPGWWQPFTERFTFNYPQK